MILRDYFSRIIIWSPATGFVLDLPSRWVRHSVTPEDSEESVMVADGTRKVVSRSHFFEAAVIQSSLQEHLRIMKRQGCPVRLIALSPEGGKHVLWYEPSFLNGVEERQGFGGFAPSGFSLAQDVLFPGIFQGSDLLAGVPWEVTAAEVGGPGPFPWDGSGVPPFYRLGMDSMPGYEGPCWVVPDDTASVDALGVFTGTTAELVFEAPMGGAVVRLEGDSSMLLECIDWDQQSVLASSGPGSSLEVPAYTMFLRLTLTAAAERPRLIVESPGVALNPRTGEAVLCSERALDPPWNVNVNPYWICPGLSCVTIGSFAGPYLAINNGRPAEIWSSAGNGIVYPNTPPRSGSVTVLEEGDGLGRFNFGLLDDQGQDYEVTDVVFTDSNGDPIPGFGLVSWAMISSETTASGVEKTFMVDYVWADAPAEFVSKALVDSASGVVNILIDVEKSYNALAVFLDATGWPVYIVPKSALPITDPSDSIEAFKIFNHNTVIRDMYWSPHDNKLYFIDDFINVLAYESGVGVSLVHSNGAKANGNPKQIAIDPVNNLLFYSALVSSFYRVYKVDLANPTVKTVLNSPANTSLPAFAINPTDQKLYYVNNIGGDNRITRVNYDGTGATLLISGRYGNSIQNMDFNTETRLLAISSISNPGNARLELYNIDTLAFIEVVTQASGLTVSSAQIDEGAELVYFNLNIPNEIKAASIDDPLVHTLILKRAPDIDAFTLVRQFN